ncbi:MAG: glycosyltransferase family 4 protein [Anaerolineales bacterium]|nr:glycosyltransferase family 4 protein [Anaerolineales bacterium]
MTHLIILNYAFDPADETPAALLRHYFSLSAWAESVAQAGAEVTVFQRYSRPATVTQNNVTYHFIPDRWGPRLRGWQIPLAMHRRVRAAIRPQEPAVVHVNGLLFPLQIRHLRTLLPRPCPIVVQHHAEVPWPAASRRLQQWALAGVDGFLFTNHDLARPWLAGGVIASPALVHAVMETSSPLAFAERAAARAKTGLHGRPIMLWTGNLKPNKDPLTILAGFERVLADAPDARLYLAYRYGDILPQVQARIAQNDRLSAAVTLLGPIPHAEIAAYYNSADIFVQGSAREGSGIALLDALACGVVPVVTDIPSFRTITGDGAVGHLWSVGNVASFTQALRTAIDRLDDHRPRQIRRFFETHWHFAVVGQEALRVYEAVLNDRLG